MFRSKLFARQRDRRLCGHHRVLGHSLQIEQHQEGSCRQRQQLGAFPILTFIGFLIKGRSKARYMAGNVLLMLLSSLLLVLPSCQAH